MARAPGARTRSYSPSLGAAALSAGSGAEPRAPLGAGERPQFPGAPKQGRRDPTLWRAPLTRPRPRQPRVAGGALGAGRTGLCRTASPRAGGGTEGPEGRERDPDRPTSWQRAACNRWEAGSAGAGAQAVSRRVLGGKRGRPGGDGSELAGGGLSPAPACPARSEDAGGRCPGPGTRSVTRRCSCWPSSVPVGPWSTRAARISSTTCGTARDPGSATQVSAAAAAGRYWRALVWELGPHRGLRWKSDAHWREEVGEWVEGATKIREGILNQRTRP